MSRKSKKNLSFFKILFIANKFENIYLKKINKLYFDEQRNDMVKIQDLFLNVNFILFWLSRLNN